MEDGATNLDWNLVSDDEGPPESYVGYRLAERFSSAERLRHDKERTYSFPAVLRMNHWGLSGSWNVNAESAVSHHRRTELRSDFTAAICTWSWLRRKTAILSASGRPWTARRPARIVEPTQRLMARVKFANPASIS